jgi:asparagine synthase (glutamine-hydrolysing)
MCGINGIVSERKDYLQSIQAMNNLLKHRGPDDEGYVLMNSSTKKSSQYSGDDSIPSIKAKHSHIANSNYANADIALGHRRLSIIDLSENGHGPMSSADEKIWITYNGEIYNYVELREELKAEGFLFRTSTDTEVIINAYLCWGTQCLNRLNGMWAFALWDYTKGLMFLARDRFGVKPLYYTHSNGLFAFSSEIKPLLKISLHSSEFNLNKIPFYIVYGNRLNSNNTYVKGVYSLQASHFMVFKNDKIDIRRYYVIPSKRTHAKDKSVLKEELVTLLQDSIKLRFRSDVPVGTCLSGGFDSSSIVSLSQKLKIQELSTFSAVWDEAECDESEYIDIVNKSFGCVPNKIVPRASEFESIFKELNYHQEIPSEGPGLYPQWFVMKEAKGKVKVLLDGQGGDEVFGGYFQMGTYLRSLVKDRRILEILAEIGKYWSFLNEKGMHSFFSWIFPEYYSKITRSSLSRKSKILNKDFLQEVSDTKIELDFAPPDKFDDFAQNLSYHYLCNVTIPALLHYEDRSSMAHSIESRVPFLDYRIVEFGLNLDSKYLSDKGVSRPLFREALEPYLPKDIANRKDKLGFPVPFNKWTKTILKDFVNDSILSHNSRINDFVNVNELKRNMKDHYAGRIDYSWEIWRLLSLEMILGLYNSPSDKL